MDFQTEKNSIETVSRAVDRITHKGRFAEFTLTNGIVLKIKPVAPLLIQAVQNEFQMPAPPKVFIDEKGREEENPNDPNYRKQIEKLAAEQDLAVNNLVLGIGTEFISAPEGYYSPDQDGWIEAVEFAASVAKTPIKVEREDKIQRYLCWLRYYALESSVDVALAGGMNNLLIGIRENEVDEVIDSFRGIPERRPDTESEPETIGGYRDRTNGDSPRISS